MIVEHTGPARLGRRTKDLVKRLRPEDVAIIDHRDLDRVSAEELVESGVRVVVNVAESATGRFPNPGPLELVRGGVALIDAPGAPLFDELSEGELVTIRGASVYRNGDCVASGRSLGQVELAGLLAEQRGRVTEALESFAENTMRYLREEGRLLADGVPFPPLQTRFRDRHAVVVARGPGHKHDLRIVRPYIRDFKPVLVGVDGGADLPWRTSGMDPFASETSLTTIHARRLRATTARRWLQSRVRSGLRKTRATAAIRAIGLMGVRRSHWVS